MTTRFLNDEEKAKLKDLKNKLFELLQAENATPKEMTDSLIVSACLIAAASGVPKNDLMLSVSENFDNFALGIKPNKERLEVA